MFEKESEEKKMLHQRHPRYESVQNKSESMKTKSVLAVKGRCWQEARGVSRMRIDRKYFGLVYFLQRVCYSQVSVWRMVSSRGRRN